MAEPIAQPAAGANLLTQLLGQLNTTNGSSNQLVQQLQNALTNGSTTGSTAGTSTATTSTSAELAPLIAAFTQAQGGMDPAQLSALITSIFTEGAAAVPALTQQFANSTGSRVSGNSGLNLALGDLNRNLSSQAVQALLQYNQGSQRTAADTAAQIAANTRQTQQTGQQQQQTAGTTQQVQQQTGNTNTQQTQQQRQQQGVNPNMAGLIGAGGTALNWLDKKGVFDGIFGRGTGGTGTIGTASSTLPTLTNGGGASAGMLSTPAASQGFLAGPVAADPYGFDSGTAAAGGGGMLSGGASGGSGGGGGATMAPIAAPNLGGITGLGGYTNSGGGLGTGFDMGFGSLPSGFNAFGTLGTESLGSNLSFGANPYDYGGSAGGITGLMGGGGGFNLGDFGGSLFGGIGDAFGGAADWIGSFFADGGQVGNRGIGSVGDTRYGGGSPGTVASAPVRLPVMNIFDGTRLRQEMQAGLTPMPYTMQQGTNVKVPAGTPTGVDPTMASMMQLLPFLLGKGLGFADGGQVQTGAVTPRIRNANYMGPRLDRERSEAMNYEGYAPSPTPVGASQPAGGSPSMTAAALTAPAAVMGPTSVADSSGNSQEQALSLFRASVAAQQAAAERQAAIDRATGGGGGSGGIGEGGAPTSNEADNGAMGIGPSGIAAAPQGTPQGISTALGMMGMPVTGLSAMLGFMAAMAAAVNAANQGVAGGGPTGVGTAPSVAAPDDPDIGVTVSVPGLVGISDNSGGDGNGGVGVGASGGPGSGGDGGPGDSGVGGDSAGDGTSGSAGTSAGGDGWKDGGLVRGPGTGTSDSIRMKPKAAGGKDVFYSDGEYVIPKDVVDTLGTSIFDRLLETYHTPAARQ